MLALTQLRRPEPNQPASTDVDSLNMKDTGRLPIAVGFALEVGELFFEYVRNWQIHDVSHESFAFMQKNSWCGKLAERRFLLC